MKRKISLLTGVLLLAAVGAHADQKITAMTNVTSATGLELLPLAYSGDTANYHIGVAPLITYFGAHGLASSGANSSITSLSGLTTPLSIAQGGTGTTTPGLVAGTNVTITGLWPNQTINSSGGGSGLTFTDGTHTVTGSTQLTVTGGTIGGSTPNATLTISASATSFTPGTTTILGATAPCFLVNSTSTTSACDAISASAITAAANAVNTAGGLLTSAVADGQTIVFASNKLSTAITDTTHPSGIGSGAWTIGGQDVMSASGTATFPALTTGQAIVLGTGSGAVGTLSASGITLNGLASTSTLHQFGFLGCAFQTTNVYDCVSFPGFGTITTNALMKFTDASGAATASGLTEIGGVMSTADGLTLTGLSSGTVVSGKYLGLDSGNHVVLGTGGAGAAGGGTFNYSDNGVTLSGTSYVPIGGGGAPQSTEANVDVGAPSALTVANLQVGLSAAPGVGNSVAVTLRDGAASQVVTCTISGASATSCSDLTHSFNVAQGDLIDWQIVTTGTIVGTPTITITANNGTSSVGVTSASVVSANGFAGTVATATTTPAITISTSVTGLLKGNGTAVSAAVAADIPATTLGTTGTTATLVAPRAYEVCTTTCTITIPVPAAGYEFCVLNDDNVSTVITLAALGSSASYENTARTAYGTAGTGTFISGGAVGDKVCIVGRDATHYLTASFTGTWVAN